MFPLVENVGLSVYHPPAATFIWQQKTNLATLCKIFNAINMISNRCRCTTTKCSRMYSINCRRATCKLKLLTKWKKKQQDWCMQQHALYNRKQSKISDVKKVVDAIYMKARLWIVSSYFENPSRASEHCTARHSKKILPEAQQGSSS